MAEIPFSIDGDFDAFDAVEAVTIVSRDRTAEAPAPRALCRSLVSAEAEPSNGRCTAADATWRVPEIDATPEVGGLVRDSAGECSTILAVERLAAGAGWRLSTRRLSIHPSLDAWITVQRATWTKDATGAQAAEWSDYRGPLLAHIQPHTAEPAVRHQRRALEVTHRIFLEEPLPLAADYRVLHGDDVYHVVGFDQCDRIDRLFVLLASQSAWPLS